MLVLEVRDGESQFQGRVAVCSAGERAEALASAKQEQRFQRVSEDSGEGCDGGTAAGAGAKLAQVGGGAAGGGRVRLGEQNRRTG